jgi:hypothetical protein
LPNPEPGAMAISPGRRVFRPLTRPHRPWPGSQTPTNPPSRRARPGRSRIAVLPYSAGGRACRARSGCGRVLGHGSLSAEQVGVGPPYGCALTRQVWPVDQAISPSPRSGRDVAGANRRAMSTAARSRMGHARQLCTAMVVPGSHPPAVRHGSARLPYAELGPGRPIPVTAMRPGGSASSVGIGRRLAPAQATLLEPCRPAPLDARLEAQHPSFERH